MTSIPHSAATSSSWRSEPGVACGSSVSRASDSMPAWRAPSIRTTTVATGPSRRGRAADMLQPSVAGVIPARVRFRLALRPSAPIAVSRSALKRVRREAKVVGASSPPRRSKRRKATGAVIDQRHVVAVRFQFFQQRLDELEQVVHLLELAAAVLIHLAVACQNVKLLQEFDRLLGTDFVGLAGHHWVSKEASNAAERATGDGSIGE